ncbi:hypothetical protein JKP88DRAFT_347909 [Tribonema minus]|uniref:Uncharacterized protein n=1 Tax=Tribonema minus TaxID=303371 RepID=A0A835ZCU6_9STRA|nr:hypothetical protein JKP88DRAFT_347909 [Tribonema minus]
MLTVGATAATEWAQQKFPKATISTSKAQTLASALAAAWTAICNVIEDPETSQVVLLPDCPALADRITLQKLYNHLEQCQDCCEKFGAEVVLTPHPATSSSPAAFEFLSVTGKAGSREGLDDYQFDYDPDWDDDWDIDTSLLGDDTEDYSQISALTSVPDSDEEVLQISKEWNEAIIAGMGICPFAVDANRAGLPIGGIHYPVSKSDTAEFVYRDYWNQVEYLLSADVREVATTLMITPRFGLANVEAFDILTQTLTEPLELLGLEEDVQLVFFHPQHTFRDGQARLGDAGAANFARRSPFPMINILRTPQVRLAQRSVPTGLVYKQNEEVLEAIGAAPLQRMLEARDWSGLAGQRVDRRSASADYYRTALKLQARMSPGTGALIEESEVDRVAAEAAAEVAAAAAAAQEAAAAAAAATEVAVAATAAATAAAAAAAPPARDVGSGGGGMPPRIVSTMPQAAAVYAEHKPEADAGEGDGGGSEGGAAARKEDIRKVASVLMKRMMFKRPVSRDDFEQMSAAVDRLLASNDIV